MSMRLRTAVAGIVLTSSMLLLSPAAQSAPRDLKFVFGAPILTLDPGISAGSQAQTVRFQIMEPLVKLNAETGAVEPLLAESWSVADDKVTWTFKLRRNVKFHDGSAMTSADVAASFNRLIAPNSGLPRGNDLRIIKSIREVDPYTIEFVTATPFGPFLRTIAQDSASIVAKGSLPAPGQRINWKVIGTGPYKYESHVAEQSVTLVRNEDYWGKKPEAPKLVFLSVSEPSTRLAMLESGEADIVVDVPGVELPRLKEEKSIKLIQKPNTRLVHLGMNVSKTPFKDPRVRLALNAAIDRQALIEGVLGGIGVKAESIIAPDVFGYSAQPGAYSYDPAKAKKLLAEAGYPNGFKATLWTPQGRYYMDREIAVAAQAQLKAIGVDVDVKVIDWSTYLTLLRKPEAENKSELYLLGWETGTTDIQYILSTVFSSARVPPAGWNTMFYKDAVTDKMSEQVASEVDPKKRADLAAKLQAHIAAAPPWVVLYASMQVAGYRSDLSGIEYLPTDNFRLQNVRFK